MPHKSRKISREGARQKIEGAAVENRRLTFLSVPPFCHQGDCMLLHRESLRGSSVICEGVSCAWTVINARIQNKSTHEPRISDERARVRRNNVRICNVALASRGIIRGFWVICYGDCWQLRINTASFFNCVPQNILNRLRIKSKDLYTVNIYFETLLEKIKE